MAEVEGADVITNDDVIRGDNDEIADANELSWVEGLRRERDERMEEEAESLKLGIPTWGPADEPDLAASFKVIPKEDLEKFMREARKRARNSRGNSESGNEADSAFIAQACEAIWARDPSTGVLTKLVRDGRPVRFDKVLGEILHLQAEHCSNHFVLIDYLFRGNWIAVGAMSMKVARWMANTSTEVEDAILGEG